MIGNYSFSVKNLPFLRLIIPLVAGIVAQWYLTLTLTSGFALFTGTLTFLCIFYTFPAPKQFVLGWLRGALILLLFFSIGIIISWQQNILHNKYWYGTHYSSGEAVLVTIKESLAEKTNSYKALAAVNAVYEKNNWILSKGDIILYFRKDTAIPALHYGSQIIFNKPINKIENNGNPAALDYNRYCLFQNITGQAFLVKNDYIILTSENTNLLQKFLFAIRDWSLKTIRQNIHSKKELGIAEALLIGYRNDLDRDLVQAYSNTGVVHIIAISGLHIAVIYGGLIMFFSWFKSKKIQKWVQPVLILCIIWLFTFIAGAAPSVLRAAVMFTFVLAGKFLGKNGNIYNTLAASAFVLLLINPYYLWDIGFQLSYAAVFGIAFFAKPINNLFYFHNRSLRWVWGLSAVSLAAQVFTTPLILYQFHQLPLLFFFSNLFIVPLSGIVLYGELLLFCVAWWPLAASFTGTLIENLVRWMNWFIQYIDRLPFSVWEGLNISVLQLVLVFAAISFIIFWIFSKNTKHIITALLFTTLFFILRNVDFINHKTQQQLIVYNVPKQTAIDINSGNRCVFAGDSGVLKDAATRNFNLKPARISNRTYSSINTLLPDIKNYILQINSSRILILDKNNFTRIPAKKIKLNVLILSHNVNQSPADIYNFFDCDCVIADSSVPLWKLAKWKKEFEQLHLRFYSVAQSGAFILNL